MKWTPELDTFVLKASLNSALCAAIGALLDGHPRGASIGVGAGIALTVLPSASRVAGRWLGLLARGFVVVVGIPTALSMLVIAQAARWMYARLAPAGRALAPVAADIGRSVRALRTTVRRVARGAGRQLATPLGLANIGALAVIALDLSGIEFAPVATTAGFIVLSLVLVVDDRERSRGTRDQNQLE